ncbi:MAG: PQQ-binding-like beta-propeller repeat protein, partial [Candidatus Coatesbacteria bacterium]|nr:PQQ-binding-like beta-propeller repeat protein [Candidatus Coatesbacteria bacterium]
EVVMKYSFLVILLFSITILYSDQLCWSQYGADSRHTSNIDVNGILKIPSLEWKYSVYDSNGNWIVQGLINDGEGNIYFAAVDDGNAEAHFQSIDRDGKLRWEKALSVGYKIYPVLDDYRKQVYIDADGLTAYTINGDIIWTRDDLRRMNNILISESGNLYFIRGRITKLTPDGTTIWQKDYKIHYEKCPAVDSDETCYAIDENNILNCIDSLGELKWTFNLGTLTGTKSVSIGDSTIFYACDKNLLCIRKDGTEKWRYGFERTEYDGQGTPSITSEGNVVFRNNNYIYCFKPDGSIKFQWDSVERYYNAYPIIIDKENRIYEMDVCLDKDGNPLWENNTSTADRNLIMDKDGRLLRANYQLNVYSVECFTSSNSFSRTVFTSSLPTPSLSISPNPFSTHLSVSLPSSGAIYYLTGQLIMNMSKGKHSIDTSKWREGVYIVKSGKETKRLVKFN